MIGFNKLGNNGHLGNQMFQYAALKGIATNRGYEWCIPPKESFGKPYNLRSSIYDCFKLHSLKDIGFIGAQTLTEPHFQFSQNLFDNCPDQINLMGFFQAEKYFKNIKQEILKDFEFLNHIENSAKSFLSEYNNTTKVSVHLRRTDYVDKKHIHVPPPLEYYKNAMSMFEDSVFFIFSDDIEWCKQQNIFEKSNVVFSDTDNAYIDFCIMSMCDHNIIANSTYSWWASYLNKNENKKIIAPNRWFGYWCDLSDLYLENWTVLQA